ncbi:glycosyltransferase [Phreatobacter oligotrophus]|uniref:Glycosyltransferase involved in cell wall biosynthesis n=1 Tax=Phreatobacter oligotrophus TaxID=1122261 RepID=A0A2T4YWK2_9HYPH|nr:glycosyltransferase [Phreatobacter oligotrophus]PTM48450.1 glycosyltransferase involved in cell wall biosynthesis [Phreatobacter oligotrophus]
MNIAYDVTHLVARSGIATPTGIDRVDASLAAALAARDDVTLVGTQYGFRKPFCFEGRKVGELATDHLKRWGESGNLPDDAETAVIRFLNQPAVDFAGSPVITGQRMRTGEHRPIRSLLAHIRHASPLSIPEGAIYLNIAQYLLEIPLFTRWLRHRPDIKSAFFIHDLIPLDYPEYFRRERQYRFPRIIGSAMSRAKVIITSSCTTAERINRYLVETGFPHVPIISEPIPPSPLFSARDDRRISDIPYVVAIGTIEPRKNYLGLINLWRQLVRSGRPVPKLVIIGRGGWENEGVMSVLHRSPALRGHVIAVSGLSDAACRRLLLGARALLNASFAEGYGIPVAEALAAGVPALVSDIPVYREISQGHAMYLSPMDGPAWAEAITTLTETHEAQRLSSIARSYIAPTWGDYCDRLVTALARI